MLYIHRWDDETPARELMKTLDGLVEDGKAHYLGTSTLVPNEWKVAKANEIALAEGWEPFTVAQPRYNLVDREVEGGYLEMTDHYGIAVCPWSPLGQGFLTGKYDRQDGLVGESRAAESSRFRESYLTEENFDVHDELEAVAEEVGATVAQTAIAYHMAHDSITAPIVGARTVEQLEENLGAADVELSDEQVERLEESNGGPYSDIRGVDYPAGAETVGVSPVGRNPDPCVRRCSDSSACRPTRSVPALPMSRGSVVTPRAGCRAPTRSVTPSRPRPKPTASGDSGGRCGCSGTPRSVSPFPGRLTRTTPSSQ